MEEPDPASESRLRRLLAAGGVAAALATAVAGTAAEQWAVTGLGLAALSVVVLPWRARLAGRGWLAYGLLVMASGGAESPLLALGAGLAFVWSVHLEARGRYLQSIAPVVATFLGVLALPLVWPGAAWPGSPASFDPDFDAALRLTVAVVSCGLAATTAARLRERAERTMGASARLNGAAAETMGARDADVLGLLHSVASTLTAPVRDIARRTEALRGGVAPDLRPKIDVLADEAARLEQLLDGLGDFARPLTEADCAPVEMRALADHVIATQAAEIEARRLRVAVVGTAAPIWANRVKLVQILVNLLRNAIAASPPEGMITVSLVDGAHAVRVEIVDQGPGIAPAVRERLFTPGVTSRSEGSGLGLVIARALAEQHGGSVALTDGVTGAIAAVQLPRARALTIPAVAPEPNDSFAAVSRLTRNGPRVGFAIVTLATIALWATHGHRVQLLALSGLALAIGAYVAVRTRASAAEASAMVLLCQFGAVCMSGGAQSPFLIVLPIGVAMSGLSLKGRALHTRWTLLVAGLALVGLGSHALAAQSALAELAQSPFPLGAREVVLTLIWISAVAVGARSGALVRRAVDTAWCARREARGRLFAAHAHRNEALLGLASGVAHEVKNPLAAVMGLAALLADRRALPAPTRAELKTVADTARGISLTLGDFLDFSRPISPLTRQAVAWLDAVHEAVEVCSDAAADRGCTLSVDPSGSPIVSADPRKLRQLCAAVLQQALDRADPGSTVRLRLASDALMARLTVVVPSASAPSPPAPTPVVIVRSLAAQHGGRLDEHANPASWQLSLTLPLAAKEPASP